MNRLILGALLVLALVSFASARHRRHHHGWGRHLGYRNWAALARKENRKLVRAICDTEFRTVAAGIKRWRHISYHKKLKAESTFKQLNFLCRKKTLDEQMAYFNIIKTLMLGYCSYGTRAGMRMAGRAPCFFNSMQVDAFLRHRKWKKIRLSKTREIGVLTAKKRIIVKNLKQHAHKGAHIHKMAHIHNKKMSHRFRIQRIKAAFKRRHSFQDSRKRMKKLLKKTKKMTWVQKFHAAQKDCKKRWKRRNKVLRCAFATLGRIGRITNNHKIKKHTDKALRKMKNKRKKTIGKAHRKAARKVGHVVNAILRRHHDMNKIVREAKRREREYKAKYHKLKQVEDKALKKLRKFYKNSSDYKNFLKLETGFRKRKALRKAKLLEAKRKAKLRKAQGKVRKVFKKLKDVIKKKEKKDFKKAMRSLNKKGRKLLRLDKKLRRKTYRHVKKIKKQQRKYRRHQNKIVKQLKRKLNRIDKKNRRPSARKGKGKRRITKRKHGNRRRRLRRPNKTKNKGLKNRRRRLRRPNKRKNKGLKNRRRRLRRPNKRKNKGLKGKKLKDTVIMRKIMHRSAYYANKRRNYWRKWGRRYGRGRRQRQRRYRQRYQRRYRSRPRGYYRRYHRRNQRHPRRQRG